MRILLDESIPRTFAETLLAFDVSTVRARGWSGLRSSALLRRAADDGFRVLITTDASIPFQQDLTRIGIAVVVLVGVKHRFDDLLPLVPQILDALAKIKPGDAVEIAPPRHRDEVFDRRAG